MESFWRVSGQSDGFACTCNVNFGDLWRSKLNFEVNVVHLNIDQEVILSILTPLLGRSYGITCAMLILIYSFIELRILVFAVELTCMTIEKRMNG